ncbi:aspartate aminotransferase family protein [Fulvivirga sp. M361]|uniref:pyridoxal phosphate-dependent decarboxylase family protein n=1 Tax=Fulvivirga sp. M361 TaxID=2594266 RepID=UPI00117B2487|nr:pyridoxal-dependent decarboxylase [Fulvivirga sp. M361]TRX52183.1 aspartate aminotransferase family protein [Fulvivirga sp. M361]
MANWKKLSQEAIRDRVFNALNQNVNYYSEKIIGIPASHLDDKVFYQDAPFLANAPFLSTLIHNPNHIGCHTLGKSESFFKGTQEIEKELINICSNTILKGDGEFDGYVASGGTEANLQAIWVYRNYFIQEHGADIREISILCSSDSHYSSSKAANVLNLDIAYIPVDNESRSIDINEVKKVIDQKKTTGKKYFIAVANMMTTMFGSVDDPNTYIQALDSAGVVFKAHVDGAYGGFFYPFSTPDTNLNFSNPGVSSITLDAHKMLQAPYGTGIFLIRKDLISYANTKEASYVEGEDFTLIGSRSGANAIAVWMILMTYGPHGWYEKILVLQNRTDWLCTQLDELKVAYFRQPGSNIVTIKSENISKEIAERYGLVPDNHHDPRWYKAVIMDHVTIEKLEAMVLDMHKMYKFSVS